MVAFGRPYIADPDLVERVAIGARSPKSTGKPATRRGVVAIATIQPSAGRRPSEFNKGI